MSVIVIKMSNGSEVIAGLVKETNTHIIVDRPRVIDIGQDQHGNMQGGLIPYIISDPDRKNIQICIRQIVTSFSAPKELSDSYLQITSGILLS